MFSHKSSKCTEGSDSKVFGEKLCGSTQQHKGDILQKPLRPQVCAAKPRGITSSIFKRQEK